MDPTGRWGEAMQTGDIECFSSLLIGCFYRISQGVPRGLSEISVLVTICSVCKKCLALKNLQPEYVTEEEM